MIPTVALSVILSINLIQTGYPYQYQPFNDLGSIQIHIQSDDYAEETTTTRPEYRKRYKQNRKYKVPDRVPIPDPPPIPEPVRIPEPMTTPEPVTTPKTFRKNNYVPSSCEEALFYRNKSGPYIIRVPDSGLGKFHVYCELDSRGGPPWTIIQRNKDHTHINFTKNWREYSYGFGDIRKEFFVGLVYLHALTATEPHELWIRLEDFSGKKHNLYYTRFEIGNENQRFTLRLLGEFTGDIFNALAHHAGQSFSTYDADNDSSSLLNCAQVHQGGWWYNHCVQSDLNGRHHHEELWSGLIWAEDEKAAQYGNLNRHKSSNMAIRPVSQF